MLLKKTYEGLNILPETAEDLTQENLHGYIYDHLVMVYKIEKIEDSEIKTVSDLVEKIAKEANDILTNCKPKE